MKNAFIIMRKQYRDTFKNKPILFQFILFPVMALLMENFFKNTGSPELFFVRLFSIMYVGMAPLVATSSIIAEEKEKNTLRVLTMANVKPAEYLIGVGAYVWINCMIGAGAMATSLKGEGVWFFLVVMAIGAVVSIFVGAWVGMYARNQMAATSIAMTAMVVLSFMPMFGVFNSHAAKVAKFLYTQQLKNLLEAASFTGMKAGNMWILVINATVAVAAFFVTFRKKGLE